MLAYDALPCKKKPEKETIPCYLCDTRVEKVWKPVLKYLAHYSITLF